MSEDAFTLKDWRPAPRRATWPRSKPYAGRKHAPPSFLSAALLVGLGAPWRRRCISLNKRGEKCGCVAMTFAPFCYKHGGSKIAAKFRPYVASKRAQAKLSRAALRPDHNEDDAPATS